MPDRDDIAAALAAAIETPLLWRGILAIVAVLTFFLPWVTLDGDSASSHGASLIANMFHGSARGQMLSASFIGGASLMIIPIFIAVTTFAGTIRTTMGYDAIGYNAATVALIFLLLLVADSVTSTSHVMFGNMIRPQWGLIILPLTQMALATHSVWTKYFAHGDRPWDGETHDRRQDDFEEQTAPTRRRRPITNDMDEDAPQETQTTGSAILTPPTRDPAPAPATPTSGRRRATSRMPEQHRKRFSERMTRLPDDNPIDRAP